MAVEQRSSIGRRGRGLLALLALVGAVLVTAPPAAAQAEFLCLGRPATIVGTPGDDRIEGTPRQDVIVAREGRDVIFGRGGNDIICGGPGADVIKGGEGKDQLEGGGGNDRIVGGIGKDTIVGGPGKDRIFAGGGGDIVDGGKNADYVNGQNGTDTCQLDSADRFSTCELGDVVAAGGFGDTTAALVPPPEFAIYRVGAGGGLLQESETVYPVIFAVDRVGAGTTTITVWSGETVLAEFSSILESWVGMTTVWATSIPTHISVDTGGASQSFYVGFAGPDIVPRRDAATSGTSPSFVLMEPQVTGPVTFNWSIGPEVSGGVYMLLYDSDGNVSFGLLDRDIGPESPRSGSVLVSTDTVAIEIFVGGEWSLSFTE